MIKDYYRLAKPGIVYGNAITALAGFFLASRGHISYSTLIGMIFGLSLIIGGSCVFNNYLDREIDRKMQRTSKRALVTGQIPVVNALLYGSILLVGASLLLIFMTNILTWLIASFGVVVYVAVYGYFKRRSVWSTVIGSIAGAVPPVVGYCAVTDKLDRGAWLLFLVLVFWQMPHFYSIAIFRLKDYKAAGLPIWSVKHGVKSTKLQIILFACGFAVFAVLLGLWGYGNWGYTVPVILLSGYWLSTGIKGLKAADNVKWSRQMFGLSLITITLWSAAIALDSFWR